ncbi:MdtA/MuxA family multidrug efflux RND transporter periplasmic adaptor subunit [Achromobacter aloeverae]|uniref:Multidrug transporter subunit MdtA n=1 Tax=Achromobacter aloeverae TaxID=1750518 RepID=A0A4Q1HN59_9BURK|nr:MdtA/MuxA family multidrug efflux RND transporter periplasmic adaptor subunit [Achromobacter aloeverae]RXN90647.1 multidrug transporter subunit MdtA [Achromobacter aloeverae]
MKKKSELSRSPDATTVRSTHRHRWAVLAVAIALVAAGAVFLARHHGGGNAGPSASTHQRARGGGFNPFGGPPGAGNELAVGVAAATQGDIPITLSALGTVTSLATVTVKSQISGYLTALPFQEGQVVKKGDLLAQVDPRPYEVQLAQYQGQLERDQALLDNARRDLKRYQQLGKQDSISQQTVDTALATVHQYEGTVRTDQAQVDAQKLNLAYCRIVSLVDGRVGLRQVDVGNYVTPSDTDGIVVVTQMDPISVVFTLPEDDLRKLNKRLAAGAKLAVTAYDRAGSEVLAQGELATVDNQIDTSTGTVKLRAMFHNPAGELFPNQFVNIVLHLDTLTGAVVVPNEAVQNGAPGDYVYRVKDDGTVSLVKVTTGASADGRTAILSGLQAGDRVVVDGADHLTDGARVPIPGDKPGDKPAEGKPAGTTATQASAS